MITEYSYPSYFIKGMGPTYPQYPFTETGQASYVRELIHTFKSNPNIFGMFYFYPDYQPAIDSLFGAYGLFRNDTTPKEAMSVIKEESITSVDKNYVPQDFSLYQNYPNPFNKITTISYSVKKIANIKIRIFNVLGQEVANLVDEVKDPGFYKIYWNCLDNKKVEISSGIFLIKLEAGNFSQTIKTVLIK